LAGLAFAGAGCDGSWVGRTDLIWWTLWDHLHSIFFFSLLRVFPSKHLFRLCVLIVFCSILFPVFLDSFEKAFCIALLEAETRRTGRCFFF